MSFPQQQHQQQQPPAPTTTVFVGTLIHSTGLATLDIIAPAVSGSGFSFISYHTLPNILDVVSSFRPSSHPSSRQSPFIPPQICRLPPHSFLIPGLIDTHVHAPQYAYTGTGYTLPLLDWLTTYTFPSERKFSSLTHAQTIYPKAVARSLRCGTTTTAWYGTLHLPATKSLGQRAFVGKVCMDRNGGEGYVEPSASDSLKTTTEFITAVQSLNIDTVQPILTPRFAVSCSSELMKGLAHLASQHALRIQTHCSENPAECSFIRDLFPASRDYVSVYNDHGLLTDRTVLAHCVHLSDAETTLLSETQAGISHCPVSNFALSSGVCDVRRLLDANIKVGLGTDVAGGWSMSIVEAMRSALVASKVVGFTQRDDAVLASLNIPKSVVEDDEAPSVRYHDPPQPHRPLTVPEVFHLATLGGARVLNISETVGNFVPGKEFDAVVVDLDAPAPAASETATSVMDEARRPVTVFGHDTVATMFEKWVFLGDDRNVARVWVKGRRVV
ncbi:uncharacterized protein EV422DRAFT_574941 [Fimicolochytrium jonesii]|uniref:uncharacterized protein n=1 Tax=Fimicolochytrium jonesii TaxID=1396493 RepID=UPI0022FE4EBA|nr:uncharacterized protein EV422DRAFT_574941 [Fimicolochytrium jonesii]KAI8815640.1 hypothetical protein EV422DRAFT_574941 [Fimicolochytrium jonesii]